MPKEMSHFECGFEGIVDYTYGQRYSGKDVNKYAIVELDDKNNPISSIAWYHEEQLILIDSNIKAGLKLITLFEDCVSKLKKINWQKDQGE